MFRHVQLEELKRTAAESFTTIHEQTETDEEFKEYDLESTSPSSKNAS